MNIHFITFSNTQSNFSPDRILFEANEMGMFASIVAYSEKDIDENYLQKYGEHFKERRGYGYWAWKPYFIKRKLSEIENGDVIVYADCGCMLRYEKRDKLLEWAEIARNSESGILSPCYGPYIEHDWTRGDLYKYVNETYNKDNVDIFDNAVQCGAGILAICKNPQSVKFVDAWNDIMSEHFELCTDAPSSVPNHPNFRENRHDQSVFSMLSKIWNIETIETKNGILDKDNSPILATRFKNDKNTWKKPIKVLFDSQIYDLQEFGGISRMYVDIHKKLDKNEAYESFKTRGMASGKYQDFLSKFSVSKTNNIHLSQLPPYKSGKENNRELSIKMIEKGDFDVFYPTFFSTYFLKHLNGKPFVMSVHDMIPELYPQFFGKNDMQIVGKREMVKCAAAIEVPTETTKRDLIRILGVDESKIHVVGRAIDDNFGINARSERLVDYKYVLYVGQRNAYKRFDWFIKHSSKFFKEHEDIHLICCGSDFKQQETDLLKEYGIFDKTHCMKPNDDDLANLYKYAEFFVFPSEYEGFGLPVLESYKMGCIALLNNNDCFREITFNKGMFFDLHEDSSNLSELMEKTLSLNDDEREAIINTQKEILSHYSMDNVTRNIGDMIKGVLNRPISDDNLDIFICTHKKMESNVVSNNVYKYVNCKYINNDTWNGIKGSFYSEIMSYFFIAEKYPLKDYVGFCHYRKYWAFLDDVPNVNESFKNIELLVAKPLRFKRTIKEQYAYCHNIEDLYIVSGILAEKYPDYVKTWNKFLDGHIMFPYNMFIMRREEFLEYIKFMRDILDEFVNIIGKNIEKRIYDNVEKYLKDFSPNDELWYQYRIAGYLAERLTNAWILQNHQKIGTVGVKITEDKYATQTSENEKSETN